MSRLFAGTPWDMAPQCELCGKPESECHCSNEEKAATQREKDRLAKLVPPEKQRARVSVRGRKGGHKVTLIEGLSAESNDLPGLLKKLQNVCGVGGTVKEKENLMELQGDKKDAVEKHLRALGYRV